MSFPHRQGFSGCADLILSPGLLGHTVLLKDLFPRLQWAWEERRVLILCLFYCTCPLWCHQRVCVWQWVEWSHASFVTRWHQGVWESVVYNVRAGRQKLEPKEIPLEEDYVIIGNLISRGRSCPFRCLVLQQMTLWRYSVTWILGGRALKSAET